MKYACLLSLVILLAGCSLDNPAASTTEQANILSGGFMRSMQAGKTTREQEQAHILSMDAEILAVDGAVRGIQAAAATRALVAPPAAQTGGGNK